MSRLHPPSYKARRIYCIAIHVQTGLGAMPSTQQHKCGSGVQSLLAGLSGEEKLPHLKILILSNF